MVIMAVQYPASYSHTSLSLLLFRLPFDPDSSDYFPLINLYSLLSILFRSGSLSGTAQVCDHFRNEIILQSERVSKDEGVKIGTKTCLVQLRYDEGGRKAMGAWARLDLRVASSSFTCCEFASFFFTLSCSCVWRGGG